MEMQHGIQNAGII